MYDRPSLTELLDAVRVHLEHQVVPAVKPDPRLYFHTLVAINLLKIAERELQYRDAHLQTAWQRLNDLEANEKALPSDAQEALDTLALRSDRLCQDIRAGVYDAEARRRALFKHLLLSTREQLEVASPRFLQTVQQEETGN
ncbi:MAG: hypothetical protein KJ065_20165 [Anaerolineae bacterium]|nr:hypothetical protein [Anaerolineae bacterium]